jgi:hypothetical protein
MADYSKFQLFQDFGPSVDGVFGWSMTEAAEGSESVWLLDLSRSW